MKGHLVYIYAGLRTLAGWHHATFQVTVDGKRHTVTGYNVAVANSKAYGGGIQLVPHAELDDGRLDVMLVEAHSKLRWVRGALSAFKGGHVNDPAIRWLTGTEIDVERRPSVHRLRGRRPDRRPACHDHGHEADPARHRTLMLRLKLTLARALRALSRRLARTGGTTLPGRVLLRLDPSSIRVLGARLERGSVLVSATNGKTTTASMLAAVLERSGAEVVHNRAGSNMNWGVATALLDAGRAPAQIGLFEVDEAWLANGGERARPVTRAALEPVPRPARPLRRARPAGGPLGGARGRARGPHHVRPERRRPAGGGPRARARAGRLLRGGGSRSPARVAGARLGLEALPQLRRRVHLRGGVPGTHGPLPLPELRPRAADARRCRAREGHAPRNVGLGRAHRDPGGADRAEPPAARALQRLQRPCGHRRGAGARAPPPAQIREALAAFAAAFGRVERLVDRPARGGDPAGEEPGGRQRGAAHAAARGRRARPLDRAERRDRRRTRRLLDLGRRLRGAGGPGAADRLLRDRAPRRWRCG